MPAQPTTLTVVYDADCDFCRRCVAWLRRRDRENTFEAVSAAAPDLLQRFPALRDCDLAAALHTIDAAGRVSSGADAVAAVMQVLEGGRLVAALYRVAPLRWVAGAVYRWVAARRYRLGCGPAGNSCAAQAFGGRLQVRSRSTR